MTLTINKMDEHGLSNTACHKYPAKKSKVTLQKEHLTVAQDGTFQLLSLVGECVVMHLKEG